MLLKHKFLKRNKILDISENLVRKVYNKIREIIYGYYFIEYEAEEYSDENGNKYYSVDESMFCHDINGSKIWVLGITDNISKNFRIVASKSTETDIVKTFIYRYIRKDNHLVTDGFISYNFLNYKFKICSYYSCPRKT